MSVTAPPILQIAPRAVGEYSQPPACINVRLAGRKEVSECFVSNGQLSVRGQLIQLGFKVASV